LLHVFTTLLCPVIPGLLLKKHELSSAGVATYDQCVIKMTFAPQRVLQAQYTEKTPPGIITAHYEF
jgi:hypothetical protein